MADSIPPTEHQLFLSDPCTIELATGVVISQLVTIEPAFDTSEEYMAFAGKLTGVIIRHLIKTNSAVYFEISTDQRDGEERLQRTADNMHLLVNPWDDPARLSELLHPQSKLRHKHTPEAQSRHARLR